MYYYLKNCVFNNIQHDEEIKTKNVNYVVSHTAIKDKELLGTQGQELCENLDVYWMTPTCGTDAELDQRKYFYTIAPCCWITTPRRYVLRKQHIIFEADYTTVHTSITERSKWLTFPARGVFIPLGSLPGRLSRYLKRSVTSRVWLGDHASERCYSQPRALARAPVLHPMHRYHVLFMPRLPASKWVLELSTTILNLSVYANLRTVQTHSCLPQRSKPYHIFTVDRLLSSNSVISASFFSASVEWSWQAYKQSLFQAS